MIKPKIKAAFIHFGISLLIISSLLLLIVKVWYPDPFLEISGIKNIFLIILTVDLILGPVLTFIVFKPKKPTLKFDLTAIVAVQISALIYAVITIYQAHPLYVVYAIDRFTPINTNEIVPENIRYSELKKSKLSGPTLVFLEKPTDPEEVSRITLEVLSGKPDIDTRTEYYAPFNKHLEDVFSNGLDIQALQKNPKNKTLIQEFIKKHGKTVEDYAFLPLVGKEKDVLWVFNKKTGKPVDIVFISPWS